MLKPLYKKFAWEWIAPVVKQEWNVVFGQFWDNDSGLRQVRRTAIEQIKENVKSQNDLEKNHEEA